MNAEQLIKFFHGGSQYLMQNKAAVDALNVFPVPDGDTGTNMSLTMQAAVKEINPGEMTIAQVAQAVANGSLMGARGNSGVILSQLFRGFAQGLENAGSHISAEQLAAALQNAVDTAYKAVMRPVEGTILSVARACAAGAKEALQQGKDSLEVMEAALQYGETALAKTPEQLAVLKEAGVVDAGGQGLLFIMKGGIKALKGEAVETLTAEEVKVVEREQPATQEPASIKYQYCTEFILKGSNLNGPAFRTSLESLGDSLLVVGTENMLKVHIHTNNPGTVLEKAVAQGTLHDIKIDNMAEQHRTKLEQEIKSQAGKELGVVAVAVGHGLSRLFTNLGADQIVSGGQTMNPSTEDLVAAINSVPADKVIVLPNNKNIIMAAQQAQNLVDKEVAVIPSKTFPQGIAAMLAFNAEASLAENGAAMNEAMDLVVSGEVTYAVRDSSVNGLKISEGDILGIKDGEIEVVGTEVQQVVIELLEKMADEDAELLTLYYGQDVTAEEAGELRKKIEQQFPDLETEVYAGGQPVYYYIISLE
ncbi:MAG: DAK2 domain-containing protein [Thermoanaerobacteraceae bacterium]|nr:DAK2 domain-containing protein [Thermoanaerobacteraceae bacterium]